MLTQVVYNLLINAINYTEKGIISICMECDNDSRNEVVVSVKDCGNGIDPRIFPRLFSKFATSSPKGTGLGLYISKNIIEAHGGRMWAENNSIGKGAAFYFILPLVISTSNGVFKHQDDNSSIRIDRNAFLREQNLRRGDVIS
jgi:two-component system, OmpR family, sensor histidine kinase VicK